MFERESAEEGDDDEASARLSEPGTVGLEGDLRAAPSLSISESNTDSSRISLKIQCKLLLLTIILNYFEIVL